MTAKPMVQGISGLSVLALTCFAPAPVVAGMAVPAAAGVPARVVRVSDVAELNAALRRASPGTIIELAPGTYGGGLHHADLKGNAAAPIVIRSAEKDRPAVFTGQVQLSDPAYVVLEDLIFRGSRSNGLNIDDGGSFDTPANHVVLRELLVEDVGPKGNLDGIKLSGVDDLLVENCTVKRWGSGGSAIDMVGCHRVLIVGCTFEDEDFRAATGVQAKGGSSEVVVRGCTFRHVGRRAVNIGGSTGEAFFRPQGAAYEARRVVVLGNTFVGSEAPIAFVTTVDSQVLYNTVLRPKKWIMRILQEKPLPRYVSCGECTFAGNLVLWRTDEVRTHVNVGPNTRPKTFRFASNLWCATDAPGKSRPRLPTSETGGLYGKDPRVRLKDINLPRDSQLVNRFGADAAGEKQAWEKAARPMVEWAAEQAREDRQRRPDAPQVR